MKKSRKRLREERLWWRRRQWPSVVLSVDPGKAAGAAILQPDESPTLFEVDIYTSKVESVVDIAASRAIAAQLPLTLVLEEWGRGGPLGIDQWIGLGESRGVWRRAFFMLCDAMDHRIGRVSLFSRSRVMLCAQSLWRSRIVTETGVEHPIMGWRPFDTSEWKEAAARSLSGYYPELNVTGLPNACEAACQGIYAMRSDEIGALLPTSLLAHYGLTYPQQPPGPKPRMRRRPSPDTRS